VVLLNIWSGMVHLG